MFDPLLLFNQTYGEIDMSADGFSDPIDLRDAVGFSLLCVSVGSGIGVLTLQMSLDGPDSSTTPGGFWADLVGTELPCDGSGLVTNVYNFERAMFPYVRIKYTKTSGTGTTFIGAAAKNN